jgi:hypothetical protein
MVTIVVIFQIFQRIKNLISLDNIHKEIGIVSLYGLYRIGQQESFNNYT